MSLTLHFTQEHHRALSTLRQAGWTLLQATGCLFLADFLSGLVHWAEDAYGEAHWPVVGPLIIAPNLLHHRDPRAMTRQSWVRNVDLPLALGALVLLSAGLTGHLTWRGALTVTLLGFTNLVHRWAHQNPAENGTLVTRLQSLGLIQGRAAHAAHHRWPRASHYCALTNHLNPLLERIGLWVQLEALILRCTGVARRAEPGPQAA
ncbi:MAG TPA: fatty acid desaturase CarF family protein [Holophagaceae bacterium]|nr:fatty acid desaturase CarF family protein [Holophagaceae bacterium]HJW32275.1 fatty acid desaturase CarF family protein [Holophagaceae bacterium]